MTAAIILAAGASSRLGKPKQNLIFNGKTLLQITVDAANQAQCEPVIIVLGANTESILPVENTIIIYNKDWAEGMASSIRAGINALIKETAIDKAILMLCDQPFISASLINDMVKKQTETGKQIVACTYNNTIGVPALFDRALFAGLLSLTGQEGARKLFKDHAESLVTVHFEQGGVDIDNEEDYRRLLDRHYANVKPSGYAQGPPGHPDI